MLTDRVYPIPNEVYTDIFKYIPRVCVDIVLCCADKVLLLKRVIEPGKGTWCLPGGGIFRGELPIYTAIRKLSEEVGLHISKEKFKKEAKMICVENHFFTQRQDICITYRLEVKKEFKPILDYQHNDYGWYYVTNLCCSPILDTIKRQIKASGAIIND
jgi:8-oxo-dGTP pyrophosphatase MutT (NUDIX family)